MTLRKDRNGIWTCWFLTREENRSTRRKTSRSKDENQQQTQPTYDTEFGNHHCAIPPLPHQVRTCFFRCWLYVGEKITLKKITLNQRHLCRILINWFPKIAEVFFLFVSFSFYVCMFFPVRCTDNVWKRLPGSLFANFL